MSRLNVALLWHMHQPCYREPDSRVFRLPWTRLHGLKDYLDMAEAALEHPGLRLTFNLVPSLVEQLEAYASGKATDRHLELTRRRADDLSEPEACFLLQEFFMANWENMVRPRPRYWELLEKRGRYFHPKELPSVLRRFSRNDLLDLQVWFNLSWTDPTHLERDRELGDLVRKGRDFTEEDKCLMLERQAAILSSAVPAYLRTAESGAAELSTTPYYHPILPLLCDSEVARQCMPQAVLPARYAYPQDAARQVRMALDFMERRFGKRPRGLWPSEGSVSGEVVSLLGGEGVEWLATDEGILERSLGRPLRSNLEATEPGALYRPYRLETGGPAIFFRDRVLSDLIGFSYAAWKPDEAAADLICRLEEKADALGRDAEKHLVPVILDGENAWESYREDGRAFIDSLYRRLTGSRKLRTCAFADFLDGGGACGKLKRLHPGSWINSDFGIWIGRSEDNAAWELLGAVRLAFEERSPSLEDEARRQAEDEIFAAEGSDWCWWYGGDFDSEHLTEFDRLFRSHIAKAYRLMGLAVPETVLKPIATLRSSERLVNEPINLISPVVDGRSTDFYEWAGAGKIDTAVKGGTMHRSQSLIKALYYGFDRERLYLRLDPAAELESVKYPELKIEIDLVKPGAKKITIPISRTGADEKGIAWACGRIIEVSVPFHVLGASIGEILVFQVTLRNNSLELERHPGIEAITMKIPSEKYLLDNWQA